MLPKEIKDIIEKESQIIDNEDYDEYDYTEDWNYSTSCTFDEEDWESSSC